MKTLYLSITFVLITTMAIASPFITSESQYGVTSYEVTGLPWVTNPVPAQADGSIKLDVANAVVGDTSVTIKACVYDSVWGRLCSDVATPFTLTRPSGPVAPKQPKLVP